MKLVSVLMLLLLSGGVMADRPWFFDVVGVDTAKEYDCENPLTYPAPSRYCGDVGTYEVTGDYTVRFSKMRTKTRYGDFDHFVRALQGNRFVVRSLEGEDAGEEYEVIEAKRDTYRWAFPQRWTYDVEKNVYYLETRNGLGEFFPNTHDIGQILIGIRQEIDPSTLTVTNVEFTGVEVTLYRPLR